MSISPKTHPLAIAVQTALLTEIRTVANRMDMTQAELIRMAIKIGLASMARINYNLVDAVLRPEDTEASQQKVAQPPSQFKVKRK